ncbi:ABC transporter ATP-binding protein [Soehngenia longivitae]|uniref:ABC transporter ATP-binding protein n=1 Tax=Soehngenia longivitae TaxID=2562294 RepID=A0A4Z0D686_9FIRM|nr:ABC transporter ATP-binding protein [Soehngenia longivitae]TFZ40376.1 ABC transporter ATP-binding protein [Soehngenia longivitae]
MNIINLNKVEFGYGKQKVLKDINLTIEEGQFLSIIGPNGAGKSTLLKVINNIYENYDGNISIYGKNIRDYTRKELARIVSFVPQDTYLDFEFSIEELVFMGRYPFQKRFQNDGKYDYDISYRAMALTNTLEIKDRLITQISGGERQRALIAKALAQDPKIILLDEPTSHLDINHQIEVLELLKELNKKQNLTIISVLHDLNLASRYSDKLVLLKDGQILKSGNVDEVLTASNIENAYNTRAIVELNKFTNSLFVTPIELKKREKNTSFPSIHLIAGGGSGQVIISRLLKEGIDLSVGVLNVGDSDWQLAKSLKIDMIEEKPFSAIKDETSKENLNLMRTKDIVVIAQVPIGHGNLLNLEMALTAINEGKKVIYVKEDDDKNIDYTNGIATKVIDELILKGMIVLNSIDELMNYLENYRFK